MPFQVLTGRAAGQQDAPVRSAQHRADDLFDAAPYQPSTSKMTLIGALPVWLW
jgi:hypothetical protein